MAEIFLYGIASVNNGIGLAVGLGKAEHRGHHYLQRGTVFPQPSESCLSRIE